MNKEQIYAMNIHYRYYELEYFFQSCQELGLKNAELWLCPQHFYITSVWSESAEKLKKLMKRYGVKICCICPEQNNPKPNNIAARSELLIEHTKMYFQRVIELASEIECKMILVTPGWNYHDEDAYAARIRSVKMLQNICDMAEPYGISLAMESIWNRSSEIANTKEKVKLIKDGVARDNFKLTVDLGALGAVSEKVEDWYELFGQDIIHCHFTDGKPAVQPTGHMPWGLGDRNMLEVLKVFENCGYIGGFSMEYVDIRSFNNPKIWDRQTIEQFYNCLERLKRE